MNEKYKHSELTGKIIGCAMEVHQYENVTRDNSYQNE